MVIGRHFAQSILVLNDFDKVCDMLERKRILWGHFNVSMDPGR